MFLRQYKLVIDCKTESLWATGTPSAEIRLTLPQYKLYVHREMNVFLWQPNPEIFALGTLQGG